LVVLFAAGVLVVAGGLVSVSVPAVATGNTLGPLTTPSSSWVDATRLVVLVRDGVTAGAVTSEVAAAQVAASVSGASSGSPVGFTWVSQGVVGVIQSASAAVSAALVPHLVASELFDAVDYEQDVVLTDDANGDNSVIGDPSTSVIPAGYASDPNDPLYTSPRNFQWYLKAYPGGRFSDAWKIMDTTNGYSERVPIAVLDTGLPATLPNDVDALRLVEKNDFGEMDSNVRWPAGTVADGYHMHGLWVSSLIIAKTNNSLLMASAPWDNKVLFYKVTDSSAMIQTAAVTSAIRQAVKDGAKVITMSFRTLSMPSTWRSAIDDAIAAGVVVVAGAGNDAQAGNSPGFPAAYAPVVSVAATDKFGDWWTGSTHNAQVDLAAPGANIVTLATVNNAYIEDEAGTSYSAPLVASVAAMVWRENPALTAAKVTAILTQTAHNYPTRTNQVGYGIVDAFRAVQAAKAQKCVFDSGLAGATPMTQITLSKDMNGDGRGEVLAVDKYGRMLAYPSSTTGSLGTRIQIGAGFEDKTVYAPGDWNGDGNSDVIARDAAGDLWLYRGPSGTCLADPVKIGNGWNGYRVTPTGDLNGDGKADLLAIKESTGALLLYKGNGTGGFYSPYPQVGNGWSGWDLYAAGDANGDGKNDILGIERSTSKLYFYAGLGSGSFATKVQVGNGWGAFAMGAGADLNGDGRSDLVGRNNETGALYFYKATGSGAFATKVQVGTGW
jgi:hypothetical protein